MLFNLLAPLAEEFVVFNLFRYITFRTGGAVLTALLVSFLAGPYPASFIRAWAVGRSYLIWNVGLPRQG